MLSREQQAAFVSELPEVFLAVKGGWGRMGATHIRLAVASEDVLRGALHAAWKLRVDKNARGGRKPNKSPDAMAAGKKQATARPSGGVSARKNH